MVVHFSPKQEGGFGVTRTLIASKGVLDQACTPNLDNRLYLDEVDATPLREGSYASQYHEKIERLPCLNEQLPATTKY